jgi:ElaB/YqjD/DUF883 family membrane-anchored ribosome-binding protein
MFRRLTLCLGRRRPSQPSKLAPHITTTHNLTPYKDLSAKMSAERTQDLALHVTETIMHASLPREQLQKDLNTIVHERGSWSEALATRILALTMKVVEAEIVIGLTMSAACTRAVEEASKMVELAEEFAHEHPILTAVVCVIVALGILYLLCPWVLKALGFSELGPVAGMTLHFLYVRDNKLH